MKQNIKAYAYYQTNNDQILVAQFSNHTQKDFLMFELNSVLKKIDKKIKKNIQSLPTSNGIWHYKTQKDYIHLILSTKQVNFNVINMFLNKANNLISKSDFNNKQSVNKLKFNIIDSIKLYNANNLDKLQQLNENVTQLQGIMKGNVNKIIGNLSNLQNVQKQSQLMSSLSMSLQRDSKALQQKMKKRKLWIKIIVGLIVLSIIGLVVFILFG